MPLDYVFKTFLPVPFAPTVNRAFGDVQFQGKTLFAGVFHNKLFLNNYQNGTSSSNSSLKDLRGAAFSSAGGFLAMMEKLMVGALSALL